MNKSNRLIVRVAAVVIISGLIGVMAISVRAQRLTEEEMQRAISSRAEFAADAGAAQEEQAVAGIPGINAENYPRTTGSTSTYPLGMLILSRAMNLPGSLGRSVSPMGMFMVVGGGTSGQNHFV